MIGHAKKGNIVVSFGLVMSVIASPAAAVQQGDCNDNMTTAIAEVQRCANIFQGIQAVAECPPCDQNGNGEVSIAEVQGAANCFLDSTSAGCRMVTPGPGEATSTPTNSAVITPTNTQPPVATNTAVSTATFTPSPVNTPTNTVPVPTDTPTVPEPTPTATSGDGNVTIMGIAPGGGTLGNCRGTCVGGANAGQSCNIDDECPGSTCSPARTCVGGTNNGNSCSTNANCPGGGTCQPARTCVGGGYDGMACAASTACNGCEPNRICTAAGTPLPCCTGNNAGTCPLQGSCAIIQSTFPIRLPLNGVCVPRSYPPGDIGCTSNQECKLCVGGESDGKVCRIPSQCPGGSCSAPGTCQLSEVGVSVGPEGPNGERPIFMPEETLVLQPAYLSFGTACVTSGGDAAGVIDCDGGRPSLSLTFRRDHNVTPGNAGNSGSAMGLQDDASCMQTFVAPDGTVTYPCREGAMQCADGVNGGQICDAAEDCPGSACTFCNIGTDGGPHAPVCNSPNVVESEGSFQPGDAGASFPLAITLLDTLPSSGIPPADFGVDGLPCTPDDEVAAGNPVPVILSTGTNEIYLYDVNNTAGRVVNPNVNCGIFPCATSVSGQGISCGQIPASGLEGIVFGGGFPALDTPASDIATTFRFELESRE